MVGVLDIPNNLNGTAGVGVGVDLSPYGKPRKAERAFKGVANDSKLMRVRQHHDS